VFGLSWLAVRQSSLISPALARFAFLLCSKLWDFTNSLSCLFDQLGMLTQVGVGGSSNDPELNMSRLSSLSLDVLPDGFDCRELCYGHDGCVHSLHSPLIVAPVD
jgi:hypothetical protein